VADVSTQIMIDRPVEQVAGYAADPSNAPSWYVNIRSVEWETPPELKVGSRVTFVARFLGRTLRYTYEIVDFVSENRLVMRTAEGPFPMETTYTWLPKDGGTTMTLRNRGEPHGFSKVAAPVMSAAMRSRQSEGPRAAEVNHGARRGFLTATPGRLRRPVASGPRAWAACHEGLVPHHGAVTQLPDVHVDSPPHESSGLARSSLRARRPPG
jgi:hypothetical protein